MPADRLRAHQLFALAAGSVSLFLQGALLASGHGFGAALAIVATASAATMWCVVDSLRRGVYWHRAAQWYTMMFWPVAVPVYILWSRKTAGLAATVAFLFLLLFLPFLGLVVTTRL